MIHRYEELDSTNTKLKELAAKGAPAGTAVIAARQTGGRGRLGRSFHSPAGGLYLSYLLRPNCPATELLHLTCAAAVAACDGVEAACGIRPGIKWTNDLVYERKKLGGILTELSLEGNLVDYAVVGIGINCTQKAEDFPAELQHIATYLSTITGDAADLSALEASLLHALDTLSQRLLDSKTQILTRYREDCITTGQQISILRGESVTYAVALEVADDGSLIVRLQDGQIQTVSSGEVSIRGMYGYL